MKSNLQIIFILSSKWWELLIRIEANLRTSAPHLLRVHTQSFHRCFSWWRCWAVEGGGEAFDDFATTPSLLLLVLLNENAIKVQFSPWRLCRVMQRRAADCISSSGQRRGSSGDGRIVAAALLLQSCLQMNCISGVEVRFLNMSVDRQLAALNSSLNHDQYWNFNQNVSSSVS